jgi:ribonuclease HI
MQNTGELPRVLVHADESCLGNQFMDRDNPGGAGGLVETWTNGAWVRRDFWISEPATTNNRMAIRSAIEALGALTKRCDVTFVSDSEYLVKGMKEWIEGWKARGWKRKSGAIENLELWKQLYPLGKERHDVTWCWVRGHAGHPKNEYANHLATRAASTQKPSGGLLESGFPEWLEEQRGKRRRYLDYDESAPPGPGCDEESPAKNRRRPK